MSRSAFSFPRRLEAEILDHLPEESPAARQSRRDLQRINAVMGAARLISGELRRHQPLSSMLEIGAGDGTLMLAIARPLAPAFPDVRLTLLDRQRLVTDETRGAFASLGWQVETLQADVFGWADTSCRNWDVAVANLFLHHFEADQISLLFEALARRVDRFIACEPRRSLSALAASHMVGLLGANAVTRTDAVLSVRAGFSGRELSALWPADGWQTAEGGAPPFSHRFVAWRRDR